MLGRRREYWACASTTASAAPKCSAQQTEVQSLFAEKFRTNWVFDVELLARLARTDGKRDPAKLRGRVREVPLDAWHEKSGSKIKLWGFARAACELLVLFWSYRVRRFVGEATVPTAAELAREARPSTRQPGPAAAPEASPAHLVAAGKPR